MDIQDRKWFDQAYEFTSGLFPFGLVTGEPDRAEIDFLTRYQASADQLAGVEEIARRFYETLPPATAFDEEKQRLLPLIIPEIRKTIPSAHTGIIFGATRGDIDIGLIGPKRIHLEIEHYIERDKTLIEKFPIVDWDGLNFFTSTDGYKLAEKIAKSRMLLKRTKVLGNDEIHYVNETIERTRLLWGNPQEIALMKTFRL